MEWKWFWSASCYYPVKFLDSHVTVCHVISTFDFLNIQVEKSKCFIEMMYLSVVHISSGFWAVTEQIVELALEYWSPCLQAANGELVSICHQRDILDTYKFGGWNEANNLPTTARCFTVFPRFNYRNKTHVIKNGKNYLKSLIKCNLLL